MGIEFKLSDRELPASPAFVQFLDGMLSGRSAPREAWPDQLSEELTQRVGTETVTVEEAAERVMQDSVGRAYVTRAYTLLVSLLTGEMDSLAALQSQFRFICVIGVPRTGGSYLTAELYRSVLIDPHAVPAPVAHDGFPDAGPFELKRGFNSWIATLKTVAEYLTMVEIFFAQGRRHLGRIVVPKKLPQSVYVPGLFQHLFGRDSDWVFTVRNPVAACVSSYEKSGGLPADGLLHLRSNMESWIARDVDQDLPASQGGDAMGYFDRYLRYWERFHLLVATAGYQRYGRFRVVPYCKDAIQSIAQGYHDAHGSDLLAPAFYVSDRARLRHPEWAKKAQPALRRVQEAWGAAGLEFPLDQVVEGN
jgi:hypothetical protein